MADTTIVTFEGVLARVIDNEHIVSAEPIRSGLALYHALKAINKIVLVSDSRDREKIQHWLGYWKLTDHVLLRHRLGKDDRDEVTVRMDVLEQLRFEGHSVGYVIDSNPRICAACIRQGMQVLLFAAPQYQRAEFSPDAPRHLREWTEIEREVDRQRDLKDNDPRLVPVQTGDAPWMDKS